MWSEIIPSFRKHLKIGCEANLTKRLCTCTSGTGFPVFAWQVVRTASLGLTLWVNCVSQCTWRMTTKASSKKFNLDSDLEFVKKFTRPNFRVKEFYTLKTRQSRLFSPVINSKNASLSVIWPSFGSNWTKCVNSLIVMKKYYIEVCVNLQNM